MPRDRDAVFDILESVRLIRRYVAEMDRSRFTADQVVQDAVIRRFEIIGEATKRLSDEVRTRHPDLPWRAMAAMRDRVIHGYDTIDLDVVWRTVHDDLPSLQSALEKIVNDLA